MKTTSLCAWFWVLAMVSQSWAFNQFDAYPLLLNPALTGSASCSRVILGHWVDLPRISYYPTTHISFDTYVKPLHGGLGIQITSTPFFGEYVLDQGSASVSYAPKFTFNMGRRTMTFSPALQLGYEIVQHDYWVNRPNSASLGLLLNTRNTAIGISYDYQELLYRKDYTANKYREPDNPAGYTARSTRAHFHHKFRLKSWSRTSFSFNGLVAKYGFWRICNFNISAQHKRWLYGLGHIRDNDYARYFFLFIGYGTDRFSIRLATELATLEMRFQYSFNCKRAVTRS